MFYGGRLLNHLSADDDEINEFIGLQALNRNFAILIDSDKMHSRDSINETKTRIVAEFQKANAIAWVTKGREIENYIDYQVLQNAVRQIYPTKYLGGLSGSPYDHPLHFKRKKRRSRKGGTVDDGIECSIDKVKVARLIATVPADFRVLDLAQRITEIISLIKRANA